MAGVFMPGKRFRTIMLPFPVAWPFAALVSLVSTALGLDRPFFDPFLYALYSVIRNLDFSNARWRRLMAESDRQPVTRDEGIGELQRRVRQIAEPVAAAPGDAP